jgi:hypothetical protein
MEDPMIRTAAVALVLLAGTVPLRASGKEAVLVHRLRARIDAVAASLDGVLAVSLRDVKTGASIDVDAAEPFPQASSIKLAVLYELYRQAEEGRVDLAEVTTPPLPRVGGGGIEPITEEDQGRFTESGRGVHQHARMADDLIARGSEGEGFTERRPAGQMRDLARGEAISGQSVFVRTSDESQSPVAALHQGS